MSQVVDVGGGGAAKAMRTKQPASVHNMADGMLADEHRGYTFAKQRAKDRLKAIEDELDRRGLVSAKGELGIVSRQLADVGLVDIKRLRADLGEDICREYAIAGSNEFWRSRTLKPEERA